MENMTLDTAAFESALRADGYADVGTRSLAAGATTPPHAHDFDVRALVSAGAITLTVDGQATSYGVGEMFAMPRGREHAEAVGPAGVTYLVGRRVGQP